MFSFIWNEIVYSPLYNGLVYLIDVIPSHDVGLAVICLTVVVRFILFPLSRRAVSTQKKMQSIAPDIERLKEKYKNDREQLGKAIFTLYRENDVHPFASFFLILIQLPILFALYFIFAFGGLPEVDLARLYAAVPAPQTVNMEFLGVIDMAGRSFVLAVLTAISQLLYTRLSMGPRKAPVAGGTFSADMARSFDLQMRYVFPLLIGVVAFTIPAAAPLYWVTGNTFMIIQELLMGRRFRDTSGILPQPTVTLPHR